MKKVVSKTFRYALLATTLAVFLFSCANPVLDTSLVASSSARSLTSPAYVQPLIAGQHIDAGTVTLTRDADTLFVTYKTNSDFTLAQTHVWVGTDVDAVPHNSGGLVNGQFTYNDSYDPTVSEATVEVPLTWADRTRLYIFTHASVEYTEGEGGETAYAGTTRYDAVTRWNFYIEYELPPFSPEVPEEVLSGYAFFDLDNDGVRDNDEPGIPGVAVTLDNEGTPVTVTSGADGSYRFESLKPIEYSLTAADLTGFVRTSPAALSATATAENVNFGYFVDYAWINGQTANGFTIGYWKTNLDKAIANKTAGTQVSKATLLGYVAELSSFALSPLNVTTLDAASKILSKTGSVPTDLLAKQLMGSEFNFANGAFIGGNELVTYFFLFQGEYMLKNPSLYSSTQLLAQKDLYDAYNNSHGGAVIF